LAPTATEEIDENVVNKTPQSKPAAFLATQFQVAQTIRDREFALFLSSKDLPFGTNYQVFVSKIIGVQVVRTPASANIDLGSRGAYQVAVGIERVQKTRLIEAGIWLNAPQRGVVYEEGRLHRAIVPPKPHSMSRPVV
jgi:hypothetical protein